MRSCIVAYIPVLHEGYRKFLSNHPKASVCYVLGNDIIEQFSVLKKDIRRLNPSLVVSAIQSWDITPRAVVIDRHLLPLLSTEYAEIIMPDEDISHELAAIYFSSNTVTYDSIFLRWDKKRSTMPSEVHYDRRVPQNAFLTQLLATLRAESEKSSDWWRRVGAALVKDGKVISIAYNHHSPSHAPYRDGDPRMYFSAGTSIECTTAEHAEAVLIGNAACNGPSLKGSDLYTTTFPCPPCARMIGRAGIRRCFFQDSYAVIDAETVLKGFGIEIILIE